MSVISYIIVLRYGVTLQMWTSLETDRGYKYSCEFILHLCSILTLVVRFEIPAFYWDLTFSLPTGQEII
jgi:hypothetical protein